MQEIAAPVTTVDGRIEGVTVGDLTVELAIVDGSGEFKDFVVNTDMLVAAMDIEESATLEEDLLQLLPINIQLKTQGSDILEVTRSQ